MRITFFGSGEFALPSLSLLQEKGYIIAAVVTAPAQPQGRGKKITPTPVAVAAKKLGLEILAPANPNAQEFINRLKQYSFDCGVVVDYGYILKEQLLKIPRYGFINLHPSLLPQFRGPAPIPRQIMAGCTQTGVTVFALDSGVDTGDILNQITIAIEPDETAGELSARLAGLGAELLHATLVQIETGSVIRQPQNPALASKAPKLTKADRPISWEKPALEVHNRIRALSPEPGATTSFRGRQIIILGSRVINRHNDAQPGTIITDLPGLVVATGQGLLEILQIKPAGARLLSGRDFRNGYRPQPGERMGDNR
jgi:methionyl-tRNA formyltransferase